MQAFGSGAMTNSIKEIRDADCIFITGSNTAESHPVISYEVVRAAKRGAQVIIVDPMLATGGSASAAVTQLIDQGATRVRLLSIVAAPAGVQRMLDDHPNVPVYVAGMDRELNDQGYILPGLGDAGDRLFGTR